VLSLNAELKEDPSINIMAINSSSIGRMAVLYYRELGGGEYVERLRRWHEETAWIQQGKFNKEVGKRYQFIGAPSLKDIVLVACGHEQNKKLSVDNKTSNYQINRLLSCVIDGTNIPVDLVKGAVARASKPHTMEPYNWEKCLSVACALVRKHRRARYKEEWGMETKQNETNRSYLFGKMLAMADYAESLALKKMGANRPTTAMRYMDAFSRRPAKTWAIIEKRLIPYLNRLSPGQRIYFQRRLDEIIVKIDPEEFVSPKKLDERYLIGFHSLRYELWRLKTENSLTQSQIDEGGEEAC